jgi:hypothetical protein
VQPTVLFRKAACAAAQAKHAARTLAKLAAAGGTAKGYLKDVYERVVEDARDDDLLDSNLPAALATIQVVGQEASGLYFEHLRDIESYIVDRLLALPTVEMAAVVRAYQRQAEIPAALHAAVGSGDRGRAEQLLAAVTEIDCAVEWRDAQGRTALMLAAYTGVEGRNGERIPSTKLVEALLAAGADVLIEAGDQNTALHEGPPPKPPVSLFLSPAASACTRVRPR